MKRQIGAAALVTAMAIFGASMAQAQSVAQMESRFAAADKDGDGKLTREEAKAGMPRVYANFSKIDRDGKGYVTIDDIKAAMAAM
ncbi:EF-hand domain-containing protein [Methylocystis sp. IM3]|jgi:Ca2+-binding EF-hand superfamily protein|uniref:EF-hand domain-containing protein n=1 Tax=unclassified Methylocystis TaxID=2625913 RepID=UPI000FAE81E8|nr:MAG: EF-hand domain-containing protein [Hyphomicrobiales bacterium]